MAQHEIQVEQQIVDLFAKAEADLPTRDFMLRDIYGNGICQRGQVSVVGGLGGGGKSVMTMGMAIAAASGKQFGLWVPQRAYRVLMINAEDDTDEQARRLYAALRSADAHGITQQDLGDRLMMLDCPRTNLISKDEKSKKIQPDDLYKWFKSKVKELGIEFQFYDPLVELSVGVNENDNGEMHQVMSIIRYVTRTQNVHTCIVHHFRKGAGASDSGSVRGAGAVTALGRLNMNIEKINDADLKEYQLPEDDRHNILKLVVAKNNHGPTGSSHILRIAPQTIANGEQVVALELMDVKRQTTVVTDEMTDRFLRMLHDGQPNGDLYPCAVNGTNNALGLLTGTFGLKPAAAKALLTDLVMGGTIETVDYKDQQRHQRKGYVVRSWPRGRPEGLESGTLV